MSHPVSTRVALDGPIRARYDDARSPAPSRAELDWYAARLKGKRVCVGDQGSGSETNAKQVLEAYGLTYDDFDAFFNHKSEWHPELDNISQATRSKLRQVLFRILREADLVTANNMINAAMLSPRLLDTILRDNRRDLLYFPAVESDLKGIPQ